MHPAKNLTAFAADDYLSKHVVAAKGSGLSVWAGMDNAASDKFLLHLHEYFMRNNSFVAVFYIILWNNTVVLNPLFCEKVYGWYYVKKKYKLNVNFSINMLRILLPFVPFYSVYPSN